MVIKINKIIIKLRIMYHKWAKGRERQLMKLEETYQVATRRNNFNY